LKDESIKFDNGGGNMGVSKIIFFKLIEFLILSSNILQLIIIWIKMVKMVKIVE